MSTWQWEPECYSECQSVCLCLSPQLCVCVCMYVPILHMYEWVSVSVCVCVSACICGRQRLTLSAFFTFYFVWYRILSVLYMIGPLVCELPRIPLSLLVWLGKGLKIQKWPWVTWWSWWGEGGRWQSEKQTSLEPPAGIQLPTHLDFRTLTPRIASLSQYQGAFARLWVWTLAKICCWTFSLEPSALQ